jgi:putative membrane protein
MSRIHTAGTIRIQRPDLGAQGESRQPLNFPVMTLIKRKGNLMRLTFLFAALSICLVGISFAAQALTDDEQTFIQKAAISDQTEIKLSRLASERASIPEIKQFAQTMVTDHTKSTSLLKPIAVDHSVVLSENPEPQADENFKRLEELSGAAFDRTYIEIMVTDHEEMLHAFEVEAAKAADSKLKDFIATVQPVVAHHLEMAKAIRQNEKTAG